MDEKVDYFITRTQRDFESIEEQLKEVNKKLDFLTEWKIKLDARSSMVAAVVTLILNLVFMYFERGH